MTSPTNRHSGLAAGRWHTLGVVEQLANVGSEVDRAIRAHDAGKPARRDLAIDRALELFDLTAADPRWRGPRRREVLRAREEFCRLFFDEIVPAGPALAGQGAPPPDGCASPQNHLGAGSAASLQRYFLHFAAHRAVAG